RWEGRSDPGIDLRRSQMSHKSLPEEAAHPAGMWPGRQKLLSGLGALAALLARRPVVLALELLDPARGIDVLHLAGEERMAGRADFDGDILPGAARGELVAAPAGDGGFFVLGVDAFFHGRLPLGTMKNVF